MHSYIDPQDNTKKSSHLLRDCRQFQELQKYYTAMSGGNNAPAYLPPPPPMPQLQQQQYPMQPQLQQQQMQHL